MGANAKPQTQGGNYVPFQQTPFGPGQMPNPPNQSIPMVPIGNLYPMGGYKSMPKPYLGSSPYLQTSIWEVHMARLVLIPCHLSTKAHL